MLLLVGLGNPGTEYAKTRHNVGFMAVDELVRRFSFSAFKNKCKGLVSTGMIADEKIVILKPETYMNLSGDAVLAACTFYKPDKVIVFHDDMDLPVGKVKVKTGGSAGGHNGLKSIDSRIGPDYERVRIGIGHPMDKSQVVDWVLHPFGKDDRQEIEKVLDTIATEVELLVRNDEQTFMNRLNQK